MADGDPPLQALTSLFPTLPHSSNKKFSTVRMKRPGSLGKRKSWRKSSSRSRRTWTASRQRSRPCSSTCRRARRSSSGWSSSSRSRRSVAASPLLFLRAPPLRSSPPSSLSGGFSPGWLTSNSAKNDLEPLILLTLS